MIKLLIFDLDGTLADTGHDITNALNYALEPFGVREYSVEETKAMVGSGISKLLAELIADLKDGGTNNRFNPCFSGYRSVTMSTQCHRIQDTGFNPCFSGYRSVT